MPPAEDAAGLPSLPERLLQVFVSPAGLFDRLRERPAWLGALLVGALLVAASALLIPTELWVEMAREQAAAQGGGEAPEGFAPESMAGIMKTLGAVFGGIFWGVILLLWAGVTTVVFAMVLGDDARFKQYFAATAHAFVISALGALLVVPLRIRSGNIQDMLSVGDFLPFLEEGYLYRVVGGLDLFGIWAVLVLAVAVSRFDRQRSWGSAAVILLALQVGITMLFAIFDFGMA